MEIKIDWESIPEKFDTIAIDENGRMRAYKNGIKKCMNEWIPSIQERSNYNCQVVKIKNWEECSEKRPEFPTFGEIYYYPDVSSYLGVESKVFEDDHVDRRIKKVLGIYKTKEEAKTKGLELWGEILND